MADRYADLRPTRDRRCYRSDGVPKKRYTRTQARATAEKYPGHQAYRCPDCGRWHVGHEQAHEGGTRTEGT